MAALEAVREGHEKLWVKTPFPVNNLVWNFFVKEIFPELERPKDISEETRAKLNHHGEKYLNRQKDDCAEIADGQYGFYWTHAYLPDDCRAKGALHDWGVIIVPEQQTAYIDAIAENLQAENKRHVQTLDAMLVTHRQTVFRLLEMYDEFMAHYSVSEGQSITNGLLIRVTDCIRFPFDPPRLDWRKSYTLGSNNTLIHQTAHDFIFTLYDQVHEVCDDFLNKNKVAGISSGLYKKYLPVIAV
ncbi:MAG TPA: hypothetical protein VJK03_00870 [Candidatus Nanoarchaeia archaeon]|nr:hypothetical protein [Candidatus Nanoarchaeia archaeon]